MEAVKRILIADAGEEHRQNLIHVLSGDPDFVVAGQTGDGLELIRMAQDLKPDVIVMELVLTGMDGLEVLEELSKQESRPRILVFSSYTSGAVAELAAAHGADFFMVKPCRDSALRERVRQRLTTQRFRAMQLATSRPSATRSSPPFSGTPFPMAAGRGHCR